MLQPSQLPCNQSFDCVLLPHSQRATSCQCVPCPPVKCQMLLYTLLSASHPLSLLQCLGPPISLLLLCHCTSTLLSLSRLLHPLSMLSGSSFSSSWKLLLPQSPSAPVPSLLFLSLISPVWQGDCATLSATCSVHVSQYASLGMLQIGFTQVRQASTQRILNVIYFAETNWVSYLLLS